MHVLVKQKYYFWFQFHHSTFWLASIERCQCYSIESWIELWVKSVGTHLMEQILNLIYVYNIL